MLLAREEGDENMEGGEDEEDADCGEGVEYEDDSSFEVRLKKTK